MSAITYFDAFLAQASAASQIDNDIRDLAQDIALGLSTSMRWPGSGGGSAASAGELLPGTARIGSATTNPTASGLTRIVVGGWPNGALMWHQRDGDHVNAGGFAVHAGSENTFVFGGSKQEVYHEAPVGAVPYTARWVAQSGTAELDLSSGSNVLTIPFPQAFNEPPFVKTTIAEWNNAASFVLGGISTTTAGGFRSTHSVKATGAFPQAPVVLQWMAEGKLDY